MKMQLNNTKTPIISVRDAIVGKLYRVIASESSIISVGAIICKKKCGGIVIFTLDSNNDVDIGVIYAPTSTATLELFEGRVILSNG